MKIKLYKCECVYCIFPFGNGAPVCIRNYEKTGERKDLMQCTEKGCQHYIKKTSLLTIQ